MSELRELYQQVIIDHGRNPRNFGVLATANHIKEGFNPLCGDRLTFYIYTQAEIIEDIKFTGNGCAISMASASLMSQALIGKRITDFDRLFECFQQLVTGGSLTDEATGQLHKLMVLAGVAEFPMRVKCATLAWHAAKAAIHDDIEPVTTE